MTKERLAARPQAHGGGVRGSDLSRRSPQFEGRFGRLFQCAEAGTWPVDALGKLADAMTAAPEAIDGMPMAPREDVDDDGVARRDRLHDDEENAGIAAGYTYLGQFIDHDLTFDPASSLQKLNDVDGLIDYRTPAFDLDSVYGRGPDDQPYMYAPDGRKFLLGTPLIEGIGGKQTSFDLPRFSGRALIGDKRNDENVIVSQLHGAILQLHNRFADDNPDWPFERIQREVRFHYQYVVLNDFLGKICKRSVLRSVLTHLDVDGGTVATHAPVLKLYKYREEPFIPIEFSAAAYRFGHSMVRPIYRLNQKLRGGDDPSAANEDEKTRGIDGRFFIFAGLRGRGLNGFAPFPAEWGIDWSLFFDFDGNPARVTQDRVQPSYKLDSSLVNPLGFLPEFSNFVPGDNKLTLQNLQARPIDPVNKPANLALRNLLRGMSLSLPSGQQVASRLGLQPIPPNELPVGKAVFDEFEALPRLSALHPSFKENTPLWHYVLAESQLEWFARAKQNNTGDAEPMTLGEVGSRIVVETFVGLMLGDRQSYLRCDPAFTPAIGKRAQCDMADLIMHALRLS